MKLIYRALIAVAVLPFLAAVVIPAVITIADPWRQPVFPAGIIAMAGGITVTGLCVRDFITKGGGTPAPWDPPEKLVVTGVYRYCRNPMYLGVLLAVAGTALFFSSPLLVIYGIILAAAFHVRVVRYEEPALSRRFGGRWTLYSAMVNRWLPKLR